MLRVSHVAFAYGRRAPVVLDDVSLTIDQGSVVGILGPNGSGKTTLLRIMAGLLTPGCGRVEIDGEDVRRLSRRDLARRLAVVPQETHTTFDFTALEMVLMGRYSHLGAFELEGPADLAVARGALSAVGAAGLESRPFATLSGGEKQRVIIAGALAQASDALLLDEPTASLDVGYQIEIAALLSRLNRNGTTLVISTHDLNLAAALCRDLVLIKNGRIVAQGRTADVLTAQHIRALYGIDADVQLHPRAGHLTVVPIGRCS